MAVISSTVSLFRIARAERGQYNVNSRSGLPNPETVTNLFRQMIGVDSEPLPHAMHENDTITRLTIILVLLTALKTVLLAVHIFV